jgi:uncharacterized protein YcbK (DUF882 family)
MYIPQYFTFDEFKCHCCHKGEVSDVILTMLDAARTHSRCAYHITSAYRCPVHNKNVNGVYSSAHVFGLAVDISTPNSKIRFAVLQGLIKAGFTRIGIADTFIHVDIDGTKPGEVCWLYT